MAEYKSFDTDKQKLPKLWETADKDDAILKAKENQLKKLYKEKGVIKSSIELYDSGWIAGVPTDIGSRTATIGTPIPTGFDQSISISNIKFLEDLLAFVTLDVQFRTAPDVDVLPASVYPRDLNLTNYAEVYGDDELIYRGVPRQTNFLYTQEMLEEEQFLESHTKKRYNSTVLYEDGGFEWKFQPSISSSSITRLTVTFNVNPGCGTNDNSDVIDCYTDMNFASARKQDKILRMDSEGFKVIGRLTQNRYTDTNIIENSFATIAQDTISLGHNPSNGASSINYVHVNGSPVGYSFSAPNTILLDIPLIFGESIEVNYQYCVFTSNFFDNITVNLDWEDIDDYTIRQPAQLYKKISGDFVLQSSGDLTFDSSNVDLVTDLSNLFLGYWLFYDDETIWLFGIGDTGDLDVLSDDLQNIPDVSTGHGFGEILPYTVITLK